MRRKDINPFFWNKALLKLLRARTASVNSNAVTLDDFDRHSLLSIRCRSSYSRGFAHFMPTLFRRRDHSIHYQQMIRLISWFVLGPQDDCVYVLATALRLAKNFFHCAYSFLDGRLRRPG